MDLNIKISSYFEMINILRRDVYLKCLSDIQRRNINRLKHKKKIHIAFQISVISHWVGNEILTLFSNNDLFDVTVVLVWKKDTDKKTEFVQIIDYFMQYNNEKIKYVFADGSVPPDDYDIIFYTSPYMNGFEHWSVEEVHLDTLICYIPYGYFVADLQESQFNQFIHNIIWKNYVVSRYDFYMAKKYCAIGDYGMVYSGYPKMDVMYKENSEYNRWKICGSRKTVKKIIYAPHHSIGEMPYKSTFAQNYRFILDYAKSHLDTTSWVFKPHPHLKYHAVSDGVFATKQQWDEYVEEWNSLPNATFIDGAYDDLLRTSDCMIFDSQSFMAEYFFADKPCLYLMRDGAKFNEFGDKILKVIYQSEGDNFAAIKNFIETLSDEDPKKQQREQFFREYLDYYNYNGQKDAATYIYEDILKELGK